MDGCSELTDCESNTTYFVKDTVLVAKRVETTGNGMSTVKWYKGDKLHREGDLPAYISRHENGQVSEEWWCREGLPHRDGDLPAIVRYYENGQKSKACWYKNGAFHRAGGLPAIVRYPIKDEPVPAPIEDRLARLEATVAKLMVAFAEK